MWSLARAAQRCRSRAHREPARVTVRRRGVHISAEEHACGRVWRVAWIGALAVAVMTWSAGCTADSHQSANSSTATSPAQSTPGSSASRPSAPPVACPTSAPATVSPHQRDGTATSMVPASPTTVLACRYHGFNQPEAHGSLATSASIPPADVAASLNAVPVPALGAPVPNCPADFGEMYALWFGYPAGPPVLVTVQRGGCAYANNGDRRAPFASAVVSQLSAALGHDNP